MEKFLFSLIFIYSISQVFSSPKFLHIIEDENQWKKPTVIKNTDLDLAEVINQRYKRDLALSERNENAKNITTKVNTSYQLI